MLFTLLTAITPLIVLTVVQHQQDREATRTESRFAVSRLLSNTQRALEYVIEERRSVLSLVVGARSYQELAGNAPLSSILLDLNQSFGGFVDLGLIDSKGRQLFYAGPYDLEGKDYKDQAWFHQACIHGAYVSEIFLGHRQLPHFVIAFRHERGNSDFFVLRATLDMELLNNQMYSLQLDRYSDAFLINQQGVLQTASALYGDILEQTDVRVPPHSRAAEVVEAYEEGGHWVTLGHSRIQGTPFILIVSERRPHHFLDWLVRRSDLIWFLALSVTLILAAVLYGHRRMIQYLREADLRRAKILHNVEYTNKMATIGRLAAGVAHELNNPLAIISEKSGLMQDIVEHDEVFVHRDKFLGIAESITKSVDRCSRVTHRLLGFAKRMDIKKEKIDLRELLEEVVGFQQSEAAHRNLKVNYHFAEDVVSIENDRGQLQQVFLNIINNAFAAVKDGGRIDISVNQLNPNEVAVAIGDNGDGIAQDDLKYIFEPFFSTKGQFGTGLGLSITREIVEKLGGLIEVESEVGCGTKFIINLPVVKVD